MVKAFSLFLLAILTACGGGGGSNTRGPDMPVWTGMVVHSGNLGDAALSTPKSSLNGVVLDGAIEGATVCLDLNINLSCDSGEPSAITAADGSYSLSLVGLNLAQIRGAHIISAVPTTAKDADDGGKTLAQAGKAAFNLMSPAEPFVSADGTSIGSVVVSPMTTLISHEMMSGVGKSAAASEANVVSALGLPGGTNLRTNFAGRTDPTSVSLQKQARFVAAALGEVKKSIANGADGSTERERQIGALNYLRANATVLMAAANASSSLTAGEQWRDAIAALANTVVMPAPRANTLITEARVFTASSTVMDTAAADWDSAIEAGLFDTYCVSGGSSISGYVCNAWNMVKVVSDGLGRFIAKPFVLENALWTPFDSSTSPDSNYYPALRIDGWSTRTSVSGNYVADGTGGFDVSLPNNGIISSIRFTERNIGGMAVSSLVGTNRGRVTPLGSTASYLPQSFTGTIFPEGSKAYFTHYRTSSETYNLAPHTDPCKTSPRSFKELIAAHLSNATCSEGTVAAALPLYPDLLYAAFDPGGSETEGTLTVWKYSVGVDNLIADKGRYEIRTVYGVPLLFLLPPISVLNARTIPQRESFFAVYNGTVRYGEYRSAAYTNYMYEDTIAWNNIAMNAILAGAGLPPAPQ